MKPKPIHAVPEDTELNMNDEAEVQHWCAELGVTEDQLRNAVMNAGNKLVDVEKELANQAKDQDVTPVEDIPALDEATDGRKEADVNERRG
jgi:hypothetical protein